MGIGNYYQPQDYCTPSSWFYVTTIIQFLVRSFTHNIRCEVWTDHKDANQSVVTEQKWRSMVDCTLHNWAYSWYPLLRAQRSLYILQILIYFLLHIQLNHIMLINILSTIVVTSQMKPQWKTRKKHIFYTEIFVYFSSEKHALIIVYST